jgi:hypothetical protein
LRRFEGELHCIDDTAPTLRQQRPSNSGLSISSEGIDSSLSPGDVARGLNFLYISVDIIGTV